MTDNGASQNKEERLFNEERFGDVFDFLSQRLEEGNPTYEMLSNHKIAHVHMYTKKMKELAGLHPENMDVLYSYAASLIDTMCIGNALQEISRVLDLPNLPSSDARRFRYLRLNASLQSSTVNVNHIREDFAFLWKAYSSMNRGERLRRRILWDLLAVKNSKLNSIVDEICLSIGFGEAQKLRNTVDSICSRQEDTLGPSETE